MTCNLTTFEGINRYYNCARDDRGYIRDELVNSFNAVLRDYPAADPYGLRQQMLPEDYLKFVDEVETEQSDADE
jgi:hypothetical protein